MRYGAASAELNANGEMTNTQTTNSIMSNTLDMVSATPLALNRIMMNDVRKRMGDLRVTPEAHGAWARYKGGKLFGARGLENHTKADTDMMRGNADMDAFGFALYGTKFFDNGINADVIGRLAKADTDVTVDGNNSGKMDNFAVSLSGELGWRFDLSNQVYIEPQTELTYTNVDSDTLKLASGHQWIA